MLLHIHRRETLKLGMPSTCILKFFCVNGILWNWQLFWLCMVETDPLQEKLKLSAWPEGWANICPIPFLFFHFTILITAVFLQFIVIMAGVFYTPAYYDRHDGRYNFPPFAEGVGWGMVVLPLLLIICTAIYQIVKKGGVSPLCGICMKTLVIWWYFILSFVTCGILSSYVVTVPYVLLPDGVEGN